MNSKEQLIAIAEALGWAVVADYGKGSLYGYAKGTTSYDGNDVPPRRVPDYLNDLNAMHEAEKLLHGNKWRPYHDALAIVTMSGPTPPIDATATQRAEAFLKTLGKWSA